MIALTKNSPPTPYLQVFNCVITSMVDPQHFCDQVEVQVEGLGASVHVQTMRRDSCILFTPQTLSSKSNHSGSKTESGLIFIAKEY